MNKRIVTILTLLWLSLVSVVSFAQNTVNVSGVVTDDQGEPVIGASVMVQGSLTGAATDIDGRYSITVPSNAILEYSFVGMATQAVPVYGR